MLPPTPARWPPPRAAWRAEVAFAEEFTAQAPDLEVSGTHGQGEVISLREVLVHMIEEYARHAGHADLLRERIDGRVGQYAGAVRQPAHPAHPAHPAS